MAAGDVTERRPRGDDSDAGALAGCRQPDRDGAAQGFAEADDRQVALPYAVVGGLGVEVDAGLARPALAAPVAAVVVGKHVEPARRELEGEVDASGDVAGVAVRPDEHRAGVARRDVPAVETELVPGGDPALLDARRRVRDAGVGKEDEPIEPHRSAPGRCDAPQDHDSAAHRNRRRQAQEPTTPTTSATACESASTVFAWRRPTTR